MLTRPNERSADMKPPAHCPSKNNNGSHLKDQDNTYIAKTFAGLEQVLARELLSMGAGNVETLRRAVSFEGDRRMLYKANIRSRAALSILRPLDAFLFDTKESFYGQMREIDWPGLFSPGKTISVIATAHDSAVFNNTMFLAQLSKDAIVDVFYDTCGGRPDVDTTGAQVRIVVNVQGDSCKVSLDSSGEPLFKRGYRKSGGKAPINEVLAAGLIMLSGWDMKSPFLDPMCGSGTFSIEAAMMSAQMPPGGERKGFGFSHWNDYSEDLMREEQAAARDEQRPLQASIVASDNKGIMLDITRQNVMNAGLLGSIQVQKNDFFAYHPKEATGWLLLNPPYGHRMGKQDVRALYIHIGDALKHRFAGFRAGIISADLDAMKNIGLKPTSRFPVFNGPLRCTFNLYDLFEGKRKEHVVKVRGTKDRKGEGAAKRRTRI